MAIKCRGCYRYMDGEIIFFLPNGRHLCKDCYEFQHFFITHVNNFVQWEVIREKFRLYKCGNTQFYPEYFDEINNNNNSYQFQPNHLIEKTVTEKSQLNNSTLKPDSVQNFFAQYGCVQQNNDEEDRQHDQNNNISPQTAEDQIKEQPFRRYSQDSNPYSEQNSYLYSLNYLSQYLSPYSWAYPQQEYPQPISEQDSHESHQYTHEYQQHPHEYQQYSYQQHLQQYAQENLDGYAQKNSEQYSQEYPQFPEKYQQYLQEYAQQNLDGYTQKNSEHYLQEYQQFPEKYQLYSQEYAQQNLDDYTQKNSEQYSQASSELYFQEYQQFPEKYQQYSHQEYQLYSQQYSEQNPVEHSQQNSEQYQQQFLQQYLQYQGVQHEQRKQNDTEELNCQKERLDQNQYQSQGAKPKENNRNQNDRPQTYKGSRCGVRKIYHRPNARTESHESYYPFQNNSHRGRGRKLYGYNNKKRRNQSKVQSQQRSNRHNDRLPSEMEYGALENLTVEKLERQNQTHEHRKQLLEEKVASWLKSVDTSIEENFIKTSIQTPQCPILEEEESWPQEDDSSSRQKDLIQDRRIQNSEIFSSSKHTEIESASLITQEIVAEDQNFNLDKWNEWLANRNPKKLKKEKSVQGNDALSFKSETSTAIKESFKLNKNGPFSSWDAFKKSCDSKFKIGSSNRIPGCSTPASSSCSMELNSEMDCNNLNI